MSYYMFNAQNNSGMSLQNYTYTKFNAMTQSQVEALSLSQLNLQSNIYSGKIILQLLGSTQIGYLTYNQINSLSIPQLDIIALNMSPIQIGYLTSQISGLSICPITSDKLNQLTISTVSLYYINLPTNPKSTLVSILTKISWPNKYSLWPTTETTNLLSVNFTNFTSTITLTINQNDLLGFIPSNFTSPFQFNNNNSPNISPQFAIDSNNFTNNVNFTANVNDNDKSYFSVNITLSKNGDITSYECNIASNKVSQISTSFISPPQLPAPNFTIDNTNWITTITPNYSSNKYGYIYIINALESIPGNISTQTTSNTISLAYSSNITLQLPDIRSIVNDFYISQDYHNFVFQYSIQSIYYNIPFLSSLSSPIIYSSVYTYYTGTLSNPTFIDPFIPGNYTTEITYNTVKFNAVTGATYYKYQMICREINDSSYPQYMKDSYNGPITTYTPNLLSNMQTIQDSYYMRCVNLYHYYYNIQAFNSITQSGIVRSTEVQVTFYGE